MLESFIVLCCKLQFLHLGLDYVDANFFVSVYMYFVIMCTQCAKMTKTLALCTLKLDNEVLLHNPLSSVS